MSAGELSMPTARSKASSKTRVSLEHLNVLQSAVVSDALLAQHLNPLLRLDFSLHFHEGERRAVFVDVDGGDFADGAEGRAVLGGYGEA
jgi:hypothetical protein